MQIRNIVYIIFIYVGNTIPTTENGS